MHVLSRRRCAASARASTSRGRHTRAVVSRVERREEEPRERFVSDGRGRETLERDARTRDGRGFDRERRGRRKRKRRRKRRV